MLVVIYRYEELMFMDGNCPCFPSRFLMVTKIPIPSTFKLSIASAWPFCVSKVLHAQALEHPYLDRLADTIVSWTGYTP